MYGFGEMMDDPSKAPPMITVSVVAAGSGEGAAAQRDAMAKLNGRRQALTRVTTSMEVWRHALHVA
jgi:hypothetical protein